MIALHRPRLFGYSFPAPGSNDFNADFSVDENPINGTTWDRGGSEGTDWHDPKTVSGNATAAVKSDTGASRFDDTVAHIKSSARAFAANQFAQGTCYRAVGYNPTGSKHEVELHLRGAITAHSVQMYEIFWGQEGYLGVVRWNGALGDFTTIYDPGVGSISAPANGDILRAEIVGNIITVKLNGSTVSGFEAIDVTSIGGVTYSTGQPGMGFWPVDSSTADAMGWSAFSAGDL